MLTPVVRPFQLSHQVVRALEGSIRTGELRPGQRLPTEKQLGGRFAVSRAVVREAIARLKSDGYVETRQGSGAFVAARPGLRSFKTDASDADGRFHARIARATHNPYLYRFVEFLDHQFSETRRPGWDPARHRAGKPRAAQREHEQLFTAIEAGDPRAARTAALRHLMHSMVRMGWTARLARRPLRPRRAG